MPVYNFNEYLHSLNESANATTIKDIVNNVISNKGESKKYDDLFLDSNEFTAVGILHFTKGGLKKLYNGMGKLCDKYFGKSSDNMIKTIDDYNGKELLDPDWEKGMHAFLVSDKSVPVQDSVVAKKYLGYFSKYAKNWTTDREYAIGVSIINSLPSNFKSWGPQYNWDAEKMMFLYCKYESDKHKGEGRCRTRCKVLGKYYPYTGDENKYYFKGCGDLVDANGVEVTTYPWDKAVTPNQTKDTPVVSKTSKSAFVNDKGVKVNKPTADAIVIDDYDK